MNDIKQDLTAENKQLREQLEEYRDLIEGIRNGGVDALAINKNGRADIFSLESTDFVYRVLVENFAEGAINVSEKGVIVYANPAFEKLLDSGNNSVVGMELSLLINHEYKQTFEKLFRDAFSGYSSGEILFSHLGKNIPAEVSLSSLYPRYPGIGILIKDLSESKKQEKRIQGFKEKVSEQEEQLMSAEVLRKSIEKFRFMGDTVPQKVWTTDVEGRFDYFNKRWLDYSSETPETLRLKGWQKVVHAEDWPETNRAWKHSIRTGLVFEMEHRIVNSRGRYRWHLSRASPQLDHDGALLMWVGTTTDIHEQKHFTQELESRVNEATVFLQTIFDSSEEVITSFDRDFIFTSVNKAGANCVNLRPEEIIGKSLFTLLPELKEGQYHKTLRKVLAGTVIHEKVTLTVKGQEAIFDTFYKPLIIGGVVSGILIVARDITQLISVTRNLQKTKKELETQFQNIEKKNQELITANGELVSFTYIASHDLQEPLRKIRLFSKLILDKFHGELAAPVADYFEKILRVAQHMQDLLEALLSYSRFNSQDYVFETLDLNAIVKEVVEELQPSIEKEQAKIIAGDLPSIPVIAFQIKQVFTNLICNSLKYRRKEESPVISIEAKLIEAESLPGKVPSNGAPFWKISVKDNGIGFEPVYETKIFELFQKLHTKEQFEGTGIGLAICNKVLQNHNGVILASGEQGLGSTFDLYLPLIQSADIT